VAPETTVSAPVSRPELPKAYGACLFTSDSGVRECAEVTQTICNQLQGAWSDGQRCSR
jgi:hypothetical protein